MKVAMLSHLASTAAPTGAERVLELLARELGGRGHLIAVSAPGPWDLAASLEKSGIEVRPIPVRCCWLVQADRQPMWRQVYRGARFLLPDPGTRGLGDFIAECDPDLVYVNCLPHLRGAAVARACGCPVVWHVHEILPPGRRRRWFAGRLRSDATRIVAVSDAVAAWLREEGLDDLVEVVHNGVDPPARMPDRIKAREAFGLPADRLCGRALQPARAAQRGARFHSCRAPCGGEGPAFVVSDCRPRPGSVRRPDWSRN